MSTSVYGHSLMLPRLWLLVGSDQGTDRQTMSVIELSWTAKNAYFIPIWTILLQKFSVIFAKVWKWWNWWNLCNWWIYRSDGSQRRKGHSTSFKDFFFVTFNWDQGHHSQLLRCWTFIISDQIRYKWADIFQWYFQKRPHAAQRVYVCSLPSQKPLSGHWLV